MVYSAASDVSISVETGTSAYRALNKSIKLLLSVFRVKRGSIDNCMHVCDDAGKVMQVPHNSDNANVRLVTLLKFLGVDVVRFHRFTLEIYKCPSVVLKTTTKLMVGFGRG